VDHLTGRLLIVPVLVMFGAVIAPLVVLGVAATTVSDDVRYQCDSAIGPDPSASVTATPATRGAAGEPTDVSAPPSANPYAQLEPDDADSAWEAACFSALKDAPYQEPPVRTTNDGAAAECAARLAVGQVGHQVAQASLVRFVVYHASTASLTGLCEQPPAAASSADAAAPTVGLPPASACPDSTTAMLLPDTLVAQGICGQRVDLTAVSPGDLVFWDHRDSAPTRVGVAVGPTELVTTDDTTGLVARQAIPVDADVRVKRVLPVD
jgi:hypothetical protein